MKNTTIFFVIGVAIFATASARIIEFNPILNFTNFEDSPYELDSTKQASCACGQKQSTRIIGGTEAKRGEFPWRVRVCSGPKNSGSCSSCGASIISQQWIMTAAHCFDSYKSGDEIKIYVGDTNAQSRYVLSPSKVIIHEKYTTLSSGDSQNDMALMQLPGSLVFDNPNVPMAAVCLPYQWVGQEPLGRVIASGWGKTRGYDDRSSARTLQRVDLDLLTNDQCRRYDDRISNTHVCTYTARKSVCQGDSGGSIDKVTDGTSYAFGVVSYGPRYCNSYGVFSRVSEYLTWIEDQTGETFCKP